MAKLRSALGLLLALLYLTSVSPAAADTVKWSRVNIPTQGRAGGWVLAHGSDVKNLAIALDGTLYAYLLDGTTNRLMKSEDGGATWSETGYQGGGITAIACSPVEASTTYVTDGHRVYWSTDAGVSFEDLGGSGSPALSANEGVTCLDVALTGDGKSVVFIGTADADSGEVGGVYFLLGGDFMARWTDLEADYDIYALACSPDFADSYQTVALATDEAHTYIINNYGIPGSWPRPVELLEDNTISLAATAADICLPAGFSRGQELFVGVAAGGHGGVYQVTSDNAFDLGVNADIVSLASSGSAGDARLLAGGTTGRVWYSHDNGQTWSISKKAPSGDGPLHLVKAGLTDGGLAYAAGTGTESGFSLSRDGGITWNQQSLIDTRISNIIDLASSPQFHQDGTLFLLTYNTGGQHSLWRSAGGGWERVCVSSLPDTDQIDAVALPPDYGPGNQIVYLAGSGGVGRPSLWWSADNGQSFARQAVPFPIDAWAVASDTTIFLGGYNGRNGLVSLTTNRGLTFSPTVVVGGQSINAIALSPAYDEDKTVAVGNRGGWVYCSRDNGFSFEPLPADATARPLSGSVTIAFDPEYSSNQTLYAASDSAGEGVYRFVVGRSERWENIDSPTGGRIGQITIANGGTLYATNFTAGGGVERSLNPRHPLGPVFESVTSGLEDGATLTGLARCDHQLWAVDTTNNHLITYTDTLTLPVKLSTPADGAPGLGTIINGGVKNVSLDWQALEGATKYEWQLDYETDFSSVPSGFEGNGAASSATPPPLEPATTYYWRVRAAGPVLSPWSDKWSFATGLGPEALSPRLDSPTAGASSVPLRPIFQWNALAGADRYELIVSTDINFGHPTILKTATSALTATAWQADASLNENTTYYWKVRAVGSGTNSPWSAVSAFTTKDSPPETSPPAPPTTSPQLAQPPQPPPPPSVASPQPADWLVPWGIALLLTFLATMIGTLVTLIILAAKVLKH